MVTNRTRPCDGMETVLVEHTAGSDIVIKLVDGSTVRFGSSLLRRSNVLSNVASTGHDVAEIQAPKGYLAVWCAHDPREALRLSGMGTTSLLTLLKV